MRAARLAKGMGRPARSSRDPCSTSASSRRAGRWCSIRRSIPRSFPASDAHRLQDLGADGQRVRERLVLGRRNELLADGRSLPARRRPRGWRRDGDEHHRRRWRHRIGADDDPRRLALRSRKLQVGASSISPTCGRKVPTSHHFSNFQRKSEDACTFKSEVPHAEGRQLNAGGVDQRGMGAVPRLLRGSAGKIGRRPRRRSSSTSIAPSPAAPEPCFDGLQDVSETDVDCGRTYRLVRHPRCPDSAKCSQASDCVSNACTRSRWASRPAARCSAARVSRTLHRSAQRAASRARLRERWGRKRPKPKADCVRFKNPPP